MLRSSQICLRNKIHNLNWLRYNSKDLDSGINGVKAPIVEFPEEPTTCCMSGCNNCVWLDYAEKLSDYFRDGGDRARLEIEQRITDPSMKAFLLHELRMREKSK